MNAKALGFVAAVATLAAGSAEASAAEHYKATITRTDFGVPHIVAKDFGSLGYGIAYAQAQDNVCLMADAFLSSSGKRSKYLGADQPTTVGLVRTNNLESDVFYTTMMDSAQLRAAFEKVSPEYKRLIAGWIAGYNRYLKDNAASLPAECAGQPWVRPITLDDQLRALNDIMLLSGSGVLVQKMVNAVPPQEGKPLAALTPVALPFEDAPAAPLGSNGWAFGGDATASKSGMVMANPHFPWAGRYRFYQMHLTVPGSYDVAGAGIINQPFIGVGFNRDVAWTHTVDTAAHMTLFELKLQPGDPTSYTYEGASVPMERREIAVEVKDGAPVTRTIYWTRFGPVVSLPGTPFAWSQQTAYAVADANLNNVRNADGWVAMGRARNVRELRTALAKNRHVPFFNTIAADRNGDAMYADISVTPNFDAKRFEACGIVAPPMPGVLQRLFILQARPECDWTADTAPSKLLPADEMSTIIRRDYIQNSNDSYVWTNPRASIAKLSPMAGEDVQGYPYWRTRSGIHEIETALAKGPLTLDTASATMLGNNNYTADLVMPAVISACQRDNAPRKACDVLAAWDRKAELGSRGAMLFATFWPKVEKRAGIWAKPYDPANALGTPADLKIEGAAGDALMADLSAAADDLAKLAVPLDAPLGEVQFADKAGVHIPIAGSSVGVLNFTAGLPAKGGFAVYHGASYMQAVTFDKNGPQAKAILTYSQSMNPASPHFADQTRIFSTSKVLPEFPFNPADVAAHAIAPPQTIEQ
ncbi:penicillin acylase family protein [Tsuneonella rigui]|uniref:penicillin acylase family protein n=1 Tax=Tsuneonella rigui TaxID=1708790 RepID=UPI0013E022F0|nr:penicillin acylase family protein [Tsuneonella rigui]